MSTDSAYKGTTERVATNVIRNTFVVPRFFHPRLASRNHLGKRKVIHRADKRLTAPTAAAAVAAGDAPCSILCSSVGFFHPGNTCPLYSPSSRSLETARSSTSGRMICASETTPYARHRCVCVCGWGGGGRMSTPLTKRTFEDTHMAGCSTCATERPRGTTKGHGSRLNECTGYRSNQK